MPKKSSKRYGARSDFRTKESINRESVQLRKQVNDLQNDNAALVRSKQTLQSRNIQLGCALETTEGENKTVFDVNESLNRKTHSCSNISNGSNRRVRRYERT